jgi:hypothetical protein
LIGSTIEAKAIVASDYAIDDPGREKWRDREAP